MVNDINLNISILRLRLMIIKNQQKTGQKRQKLLTDVDEKLHVMKFGRQPYGPFRYNTDEERKQARKAQKTRYILATALISTIIHLLEKPGI